MKNGKGRKEKILYVCGAVLGMAALIFICVGLADILEASERLNRQNSKQLYKWL